MSLDDFIITHFTRGAGINTLSTLIYSQVRRGIQPSMYALSSVIFLTVLVLLLITNYRPRQKKSIHDTDALSGGAFHKNSLPERIQKSAMAAAAVMILFSVAFITFKKYTTASSNELYVYNWGEYIDEEVVAMFEEETGIDVTYDMFETKK